MLGHDHQNHLDSMEDLLAKFGIKLAHVITGLIAGSMGLLFNKKVLTRREKIRAYIIVVCGAILTGYLTPLLLVWAEWLQEAEYAVAFLVGLFGMGILEIIFDLIEGAKTNPTKIIELYKKWKDR